MKIYDPVLSSSPAGKARAVFLITIWLFTINVFQNLPTLALELTSGDDIIVNTGTMIAIDGLAGNDTITNNGTVTLAIYGDSGNDIITNNGIVSQIYGGEGDDIITNNGTIYGHLFGGTDRHLSGGPGADTIINNGTIGYEIYGDKNWKDNMKGGYNTIINSGIVKYSIKGSYNWGAGTSGGSNTIINYGEIWATIVGSENVVFGTSGEIGGNNTIINHGVVWQGISGTKNFTNYNSGGNNTIINTGTVGYLIYGSYNSSYSIGGNNTINNSGTMNGEILGSWNGGNYGSGSNNAIKNSGIVNGNINGSLNDGSYSIGGNHMINNSGRVNGSVYGSNNTGNDSWGGNNTIINSGTVTGNIYGSDNTGAGSSGNNNILELADTGHVGGDISGFDRLRKTGEGTATVGGNLNLPGLSHTSIQGSAGFYPAIIAGSANLAGDLEPYGYYPTGTVVLIRTGGLTGGFSNIIDHSPVLNFTVTNNGNNIELTTARLPYTQVLSNLSGPEFAVAEIMEDKAPSADGDLAYVIGELDFLSKSDMRGAFNQLWPTTLSGVNSVGHINSSLFSGSTITRMQNLRTQFTAGDRGPFNDSNKILLASADGMTGLGEIQSSQSGLNGFNNMLIHMGEREATSESIGYKYDTVGSVLGMDRAFGTNLVGGFDAAYINSDIDYEDEGNSRGKVETVSAGFYGSGFFNQWYIDTAVFGGYNRYESDRRIRFGSLSRTAEAKYKGWMAGARLCAGYDFMPAGFTVTPEASVDYVYLSTSSYTEKGADDLNLHVDGTSTNFLSTVLGLNVSHPFEASDGITFIPSLYAGWRHEFLGNDEDIKVYLAGAPSDTFYIDTAEPDDRDSTLIGLAVLIKGKRASFNARYQARLSGDLDTHQFSAEFRYAF